MSEETTSRQFVDGNGNTYRLDPDGPTLRKIRDDLGVNLATTTGYVKLRLDPLLVADVMEYLCSRQREEFKRSQEDFSRDVLKSKGKAIEAIAAVMEDFLPDELVEDLREKKQATTAELSQLQIETTIYELIEKGDPAVIRAAVEAAMS